VTTKEDRVAALDEAVRRGGGIVKFAKALGISHQAIYHWRKRGWVPLQRAVAIEAIFKVERDRLLEPSISQALNANAVDLI
jgi:transposase-like protein